MKNLNMPTAIIIATIIICITAYLISSNDPLANCMETVMKTQESITAAGAAKFCNGG